MNQALTPNDPWHQSDYAEQYFACEHRYLDMALKQAAGPAVLQVGEFAQAQVVDALDLPFIVRSHPCPDESINSVVDLFLDPAFLPFPEKSLTTVILPHVLEQHRLPHQVLREAHRVLKPEGHLVLTGFNPFSFVGLQNKIYKRAALKGRYYATRRVIDWLQLLGFEVVGSAMYQYGPLSKSQSTRKALNFLESVGGRWLPIFGGAYMITAKKKEVGMTMVGRVKYRARKRKFRAAPAKTSLKLNDK